MRIDLLRPESVLLALALTFALAATMPGYGDDAPPGRAQPTPAPAPTAPTVESRDPAASPRDDGATTPTGFARRAREGRPAS